MFLTSLILSIGIISALYRVNSSLTLITGLLFFLIYLAIAVSTKKFVIDTGYIFEQTSKKRIEVIQQAIGGIRDIIIDRSQNFLLKEYSLNVIKQLRTQAILQFLSLSPRYFLEGLGIFFIAIVTIILTSLESNALKSIAVIAIGAQRLLPSLNQLFNGWMGILARRASLEIVSSEIDKKNVQTKNLNFQKSLKFGNSILLNKVFYGYPNSEKLILKDINLLIKRGEKIGIIGKTGSGKTTLTDLLLGLLYPTKGEIKIDGIKLDDSNASNWHSQISHVPQSLFISNSSIADNIAFCTNLNSSILKRVKEVAEIVGIDEFIESLPEKYNTGVGERGIRLSGGQIQRLAIARALFKKPKVLILDEATSALDNKTQNNVMNSLQDFLKETTLIQITHRTSNLDFCDRVLLVENCQVIET